jgi:hypothetical protein
VYDVYSTTADDTEPLEPISSEVADNIQFSMADKAIVISMAPGMSFCFLRCESMAL